ncbi:hypothetical protein HPB48_010694 [Haemaphysalis longicornis]|uniref:Uncharacterized protein n=1 Tax=Haemaphysalis longicornis TaxID=44386 RepID=A0A9J6G3H6_HAELO|nr:hypothetical protein HPB48_010694 [Haemaphysalis longicornis]
MVDWCQIATSSGALSLHLSVPLMFPPNLLVCFLGYPVPSIKASTLGLIAGFRKRTVEEHIKCSLCVERLKAPRSSGPATAVIFNLDGVGYLIRGFSSWNSSVHWKERPKHSQNLRYPTKTPIALFVRTMLPDAL